MRRFAVIIAVSAAAACTFSLNANAAAKAPIKTYTEQASLSFTGIGSAKGFYSKEQGGEKVALSPQLAVASSVRTSFRLQGVVHNASRLFDIVGNHTYTKANNGRWVTGTLSEGPGLRRAGRGPLREPGPVRQAAGRPPGQPGAL
jgi:hypothetical protein